MHHRSDYSESCTQYDLSLKVLILLGTVASFHIPEWPVYMIFGIDAIMDMARTSVNVIGNCLAAVVIAKSEGEFEESI